MSNQPVAVFDTECYPNYWLLAFKDIDTGRVRQFSMRDGKCLLEKDINIILNILNQYTIVGFNSLNYDIPMISFALTGANTNQLKELNDMIILKGVRYWEHDHDLVTPHRHIDLFEVAPGTRTGLKTYGGRINAPKMQDLPYPPDAVLTSEKIDETALYCVNDLDTTALLYINLLPQLELRKVIGEQYGLDLMSKSDAQIAEAIIKSEVEMRTGQKVPKPVDRTGDQFKYEPPGYIEFQTPDLQEKLQIIRNSNFVVNDTGAVSLPAAIKEMRITIGNSTYQPGIGGLHSTEKCAVHKADEHTKLYDFDVASFYPSIILNCGLAPSQLGEHFAPVYSQIVQRRLAAKRSGDTVTADSLKITINGTFGKLGSKYSTLYSPELLIQTTLTGQLSLLMLIEMFELQGISVVSANTDGVVVKCPDHLGAALDTVLWTWEKRTGFMLEETSYRAIYSRDVNNYIAHKENGFKVKGVYSPGSLMKNPANTVVTRAVLAYLESNTPISKTIQECDDIRGFINIRNVKGGAVDQNDVFLGKVVRWYYSTSVTDPLRYASNGNKVATSEGAKPLMELPSELPNDIDYNWYINKAYKVLDEIGAKAA